MRRKTLCLLVVVSFVASLLGTALPVQPAAASVPGDMQWVPQDLPTNMGNVILSGSDVTDMAVSASAIYVIDGTSGAGDNVYRSTNGGASFTKTASPPSAAALRGISVAPDNSNAVAVFGSGRVHVSSDGGGTWLTLPVLPAPWTGAAIKDLAVCPARGGTLLGREYVIAVTDPMAGVTTRGDVLIIGGIATWTSVLPAGFTNPGLRDYVAVAVSPNFLADRSVVALGAAATAGMFGNNGVVAQVINTASNTIVSTAYLFNPAATTTDHVGTAPLATSIVNGSIALPSDFDATTSAGRLAYVGFASNIVRTDNDVYLVGDSLSRALGAVTAQGIWSVSYAGSIASGTLFEGRMDIAEAKYSTNPTSAVPTWSTTVKLLPMFTTRTIIAAAPDFTNSNRVYAGTTGAESAFSVSSNGGISFNQRSLIDNSIAVNNVNRVTGLALTPDGKTVFLGSVASGNINLWMSPTPVSNTSWRRIFVAPGTTGAVFVSPDYATTSTLYLFDLAAGGNIYRSADGGATFNNRLGPASTYIISTWAFEDASIGYVTDVAGNIYRTTNGAWDWTGPVSASVGIVRSLAVGKPGSLIVGGTGKIAYSNVSWTDFTIVNGNGGESYRVARDPNIATSNTIYLGDASGTTNCTYRLKIGTDTAPVDLLAPTGHGPVISLSSRSGALYSFHGTLVDRTLNPLGNPGGPGTPNAVGWRTMDTPLLSDMTAGASAVDVNPVLYVRNGTVGSPQVWAYSDYLAVARPVLTSPANGAAVNPAELVTLTWNGMGDGSGQVTAYQVQIAETAVGWSSGVTSADIFVASPASPSVTMGPGGQFAFTLLPGKEYQWRVRASNEASGDRIDSRWSDPFILKANKSNASVTLGNLSQTYDGTSKSATATTDPLGLNVTFTYDGSATAPTNAGSYAVVATINDPSYQGSASGTLVIAKADQTITFGALANKTYGDPDFQVIATASSGLTVDFTASGNCTVLGDLVHINGVGICTITASQGGNGNYNAASPVSQSFTVNITYDRLRHLVDEFVTKKGIVNSLSAKLDAAEAAQARGDVEARAGVIGAFINEVEAQTSKSISQEDAATLIALAQAL